MTTRADVGNAVHNALDQVSEQYPLDQVIRTLEGRYGPGDWERLWLTINGQRPTAPFESAVVCELKRIHFDVQVSGTAEYRWPRLLLLRWRVAS